MDCINLIQDRNKWWDFVNAVMNLLSSIKMVGNSWVAEQLMASQERLSSMEFS
jgi:hypothetical protein